MIPETSALEDVCQAVSQQIQAEFKDITLFFIVHTPDQRMKALERKERDILYHPAGKALLPTLKLCGQFKPDISMFAGLAFAETTRYFGLKKSTKTIAAFFVNTHEFDMSEDMRQYVYHLAWHGLSLLKHYEEEEKEYYLVNDGAVRPAYNLIHLARENMLADAFSAILLELQGKNNVISSLSKKRCEMTMQPIVGFRAEQYPYPIAADATQIVYEDLMRATGAKGGVIQRAIDLTQEISFTFDNNAIRQWAAFSMAAQEMAWLDFDKKQILGSAIYTSEDPYVRSTAYIVSETLRIDPMPITSFSNLNPFTDDEANERLHNKRCDEIFQTLMNKLEDGIEPFREKARAQNQRLLTGYPVGWCGHALKEAATEFLIADENEDEKPEQKALEVYQSARQKIPWSAMSRLSHLIMNKRRQGLEMRTSLMIELCEGHTDFNDIAAAFEWAPPEPLPTEEKIEADTKNKLKKIKDDLKAKDHPQGSMKDYM